MKDKFSVNGNLDKIMNQMTDEWMQSSVLVQMNMGKI